MGVFGGPSRPSREGPGVGHRMVSDTKQMTKGKKIKKRSGKREKCVKKKKWKKERKRNGQKSTGRDNEMLLDTDRGRNIDILDKTVSIFCRTHIAVGHRIQRGSPGPLLLKYTVEYAAMCSSVQQQCGAKGSSMQPQFVTVFSSSV